jgi:hypothetical protein
MSILRCNIKGIRGYKEFILREDAEEVNVPGSKICLNETG